MPVLELEVRWVESDDRRRAWSFLVFDFQSEHYTLVAFVSDVGDLVEGHAREEVDLFNLDTIDFETSALDILIEPGLLEGVRWLTHG